MLTDAIMVRKKIFFSEISQKKKMSVEHNRIMQELIGVVKIRRTKIAKITNESLR